MFHFYKKFVITTNLDVLRDPDDFDRKVDERVRYFKNIAKAFGIAYEQVDTRSIRCSTSMKARIGKNGLLFSPHKQAPY